MSQPTTFFQANFLNVDDETKGRVVTELKRIGFDVDAVESAALSADPPTYITLITNLFTWLQVMVAGGISAGFIAYCVKRGQNLADKHSKKEPSEAARIEELLNGLQTSAPDKAIVLQLRDCRLQVGVPNAKQGTPAREKAALTLMLMTAYLDGIKAAVLSEDGIPRNPPAELHGIDAQGFTLAWCDMDRGYFKRDFDPQGKPRGDARRWT